ncbi:MAG: hypothetical protein ACOCXQ_04085 [Patescibacteria group bacterium]
MNTESYQAIEAHKQMQPETIRPEVTQAIYQSIEQRFSTGTLVLPTEGGFKMLDPHEQMRQCKERYLAFRPALVMTEHGTATADLNMHDFDGTSVLEGVDEDKRGSEANKSRPEALSVAAFAYNGIEANPDAVPQYHAVMTRLRDQYPGHDAFQVELHRLMEQISADSTVEQNYGPKRRNGIATGRTLGEILIIKDSVEEHGGTADGLLASEDGTVIGIPKDMLLDENGEPNEDILNIAIFKTFVAANKVDTSDYTAIQAAMQRFLDIRSHGGWGYVDAGDRYIANLTDHTIHDFAPVVDRAREIGAAAGYQVITSMDEGNDELVQRFGDHCGHHDEQGNVKEYVTRAALDRKSSVVLLMPEDPVLFQQMQQEIQEAADAQGIEVRGAHTDILELHFPGDNKSKSILFADALSQARFGIPAAPNVYGNKHNDIPLLETAIQLGGHGALMPDPDGNPYLPTELIPPGVVIAQREHAFGLVQTKADFARKDRMRSVN